MQIQPVSDKAAWRAADISPGLYEVRFDAADIADFDQAISALAKRGITYEQATLADFKLPRASAKITKAYEIVKDGIGFVVFRGLPALERDADWMRMATWGIGAWFGDAVNQVVIGRMLVDVMDASRSETNTRYYNTPHPLDFHIDPASDIIGLSCIRSAKDGGESSLCSAVTIHNEMARTRPDLLALLYRGFHMHRFGECWPEDGDITKERTPFFCQVDGKVSFRGFQKAMVAAHRDLNLPLTDAENEALELFNTISKDPANSIDFKLEAGDFLITNNLAILHGRKQFSNTKNDPNSPRHLLRLWLEGRNFRPIDPRINYFNRGRSGIPLVVGAQNAYHDTKGLATDPTWRTTKGDAVAS